MNLTPRPLLAAGVLAWREVLRFFRQRNRIVGAVGTPVLFWLLFGTGLRGSFRLEGGDAQTGFLEYYLPGTMVLILMFTAIFTTISVIEDRREGFLQAVFVAPVPAWALVLGKVAGGSLIAVSQALIFLLLALGFQVGIAWQNLLPLVGLLSVAAVGLTSAGLIIAWRMESTQGFHAIMNLVLMPAWLLSGAFFPVPSAGSGPPSQQLMHWCMRLNPLTYCVAGVRELIYGGPTVGATWAPGSVWTSWAVTLTATAVAFGLAWAQASRQARGKMR